MAEKQLTLSRVTGAMFAYIMPSELLFSRLLSVRSRRFLGLCLWLQFLLQNFWYTSPPRLICLCCTFLSLRRVLGYLPVTTSPVVAYVLYGSMQVTVAMCWIMANSHALWCRSFAEAGPKVWNHLPAHIPASDSVNSFQSALGLKTFCSADYQYRPDTSRPCNSFSMLQRVRNCQCYYYYDYYYGGVLWPLLLLQRW